MKLNLYLALLLIFTLLLVSLLFLDFSLFNLSKYLNGFMHRSIYLIVLIIVLYYYNLLTVNGLYPKFRIRNVRILFWQTLLLIIIFIKQVIGYSSEFDLFWQYSLFHLSVGLFEEIVFRGIILIVLIKFLVRSKFKIHLALIFSSVLFGIMHIFNGSESFDDALSIAITTGIIGLFLGSLFILCGNIIITGLLHAIINISFSKMQAVISETQSNNAGQLFSLIFITFFIGLSLYNIKKVNKKVFMGEVNLIGFSWVRQS